jgi:hypothetical protein
MSDLKAYCDGYLTRQQFIEVKARIEEKRQRFLMELGAESHPQAKTGHDTNER